MYTLFNPDDIPADLRQYFEEVEVECGAAWVRVVEKVGERETHGRNTATDVSIETVEGRRRRLGATSAFHTGRVPITETTGFAPSCACPGNTGSAASVVLDPFAGSGTVLRVAARYQRDAIGIELSQDYIEQHIEKRTNGLQVEMFV